MIPILVSVLIGLFCIRIYLIMLYNKIERNRILFICPAVFLDFISCPKGFNNLFSKGLKNSGASLSLLLPGVQVPLIFASKLVNEHCLSLSFQSNITIGINTIIYFNHSPGLKNELVTISIIKNTCIQYIKSANIYYYYNIFLLYYIK